MTNPLLMIIKILWEMITVSSYLSKFYGKWSL